jgi:hypothetical protein
MLLFQGQGIGFAPADKFTATTYISFTFHEMAPILGKKLAKGPAKKKAQTFTIDCR